MRAIVRAVLVLMREYIHKIDVYVRNMHTKDRLSQISCSFLSIRSCALLSKHVLRKEHKLKKNRICFLCTDISNYRLLIE